MVWCLYVAECAGCHWHKLYLLQNLEDFYNLWGFLKISWTWMRKIGWKSWARVWQQKRRGTNSQRLKRTLVAFLQWTLVGRIFAFLQWALLGRIVAFLQWALLGRIVGVDCDRDDCFQLGASLLNSGGLGLEVKSNRISSLKPLFCSRVIAGIQFGC